MAGFIGNRAFLGKPVGDEWFKQEYKKDEFYNHSNDIIDQCLTNIGLASDIINENQRRMKEHRVMYPEYYKRDDFSKGGPVGVPGKPDLFRGSRGAMTQRMLERIASRQEAGLSAEEILCDIMQDSKQSMELRFRAASKVADLVYPKAASVEIDVDNKQLSLEEIDSRLISLLQKNYVQRVEKVIPSVAEDVLIEEDSQSPLHPPLVEDKVDDEESVVEGHVEDDMTSDMGSHDDTHSMTSHEDISSFISAESVSKPSPYRDSFTPVVDDSVFDKYNPLPDINSLESVEWEPSPDVESFQISSNWAYNVGSDY